MVQAPSTGMMLLEVLSVIAVLLTIPLAFMEVPSSGIGRVMTVLFPVAAL